jgi:hypothetical protein|tara:strand:- start:115 stop:231 length:117 start_codon:yes stop_codon:yes gene_type:complete
MYLKGRLLFFDFGLRERFRGNTIEINGNTPAVRKGVIV